MKKILSSLFALALVAIASTTQPAKADAPLVTITGTVVSVDGDVLVLSTDKGNLTFDLDKDTVRPATLPVGSRITISYDSDDKVTDKMDARQIVMAPAVSSITPPPTTPAPEPTRVQSEPTPTPTTTPVNEESTELPATASPLPLVGVLGLLALAGGLMLRKPRRM